MSKITKLVCPKCGKETKMTDDLYFEVEDNTDFEWCCEHCETMLRVTKHVSLYAKIMN